jgi:hypothetical protein
VAALRIEANGMANATESRIKGATDGSRIEAIQRFILSGLGG